MTALMFRMVPYKSLHHLTDTKVTVNLSLQITEDGTTEYRFYQLPLERSRIDMFNMNWTVVHPISEDSPLLNFTKEDLDNSDAELMVQVTRIMMMVPFNTSSSSKRRGCPEGVSPTMML